MNSGERHSVALRPVPADGPVAPGREIGPRATGAPDGHTLIVIGTLVAPGRWVRYAVERGPERRERAINSTMPAMIPKGDHADDGSAGSAEAPGFCSPTSQSARTRTKGTFIIRRLDSLRQSPWPGSNDVPAGGVKRPGFSGGGGLELSWRDVADGAVEPRQRPLPSDW